MTEVSEPLTLARGKHIQLHICLFEYVIIKHEYIVTDVKRSIELLEKLQASGDFPTTKLAALQKVLNSDFLNSVREVYEHVYETVDIQGSHDVRASATAKATVAAFAASEGHAHPRVVELPKTEEGLYIQTFTIFERFVTISIMTISYRIRFQRYGRQGTKLSHLYISNYPRWSGR